ncbi:hypothetical protein Acife_0506 [Acidithiobacillus ferrivorans SS3]|uniref:Uncharacterized protein n=1 Tax=Acidithiobacillus ferrivorans SS3 TaxID=743299 RepID=G0JTW1_9PROT|nr:hypothetical protein [Acidithiobacillus ferrivorans]AEM46713.1 hypothetical protein Acife_0506 [Acidithiobacillus ferrivorans SS3]OFA16126.1 hypothetical protein A4U49_09100 [Acidithiobacillus ferrivorans]
MSQVLDQLRLHAKDLTGREPPVYLDRLEHLPAWREALSLWPQLTSAERQDEATQKLFAASPDAWWPGSVLNRLNEWDRKPELIADNALVTRYATLAGSLSHADQFADLRDIQLHRTTEIAPETALFAEQALALEHAMTQGRLERLDPALVESVAVLRRERQDGVTPGGEGSVFQFRGDNDYQRGDFARWLDTTRAYEASMLGLHLIPAIKTPGPEKASAPANAQPSSEIQDHVPPAMSEAEWESLQQAHADEDPKASSAPPLDLPDDQQAAVLAAQRDAEEKALQDMVDPRPLPEEAQDKPVPVAPAKDAGDPAPLPPPGPTSTAQNHRPTASPTGSGQAPGQQQPRAPVQAQTVVMRSPGLLAQIAQRLIPTKADHQTAEGAKEQASQADKARETFSALHEHLADLKIEGWKLSRHPMMDVVRKMSPDGLENATDQQKTAIAALLQKTPDLRKGLQRLQEHALNIERHVDAVQTQAHHLPEAERSSWESITGHRLRGVEESIRKLPDPESGGSLWDRVESGLRRLGQWLGIVGTEQTNIVKQEVRTAPSLIAEAPAASSTPPPSYHPAPGMRH